MLYYRTSLARQLHAQNQAAAAHFLHLVRIFSLQLFQLADKVFALLRHLLHQALGLNSCQRSIHSSAGQRVTAKGAAMVTGLKHASQALRYSKACYREAAANTLSKGQHIGLHAAMHIAKPFARAGYTGLHLVKNQQCIVFIAQCAHLL